jgi:hypothetical protein
VFPYLLHDYQSAQEPLAEGGSMAELLTIRMLDSGPNGNYAKGQTVAVDALRAAVLIKCGAAEDPAKPRKPKEVDSGPVRPKGL